jgi:hypothetical protein
MIFKTLGFFVGISSATAIAVVGIAIIMLGPRYA